MHFDIVTPEKLVSSEEVEMAVVPGKEGDFGILSGHAPFISSLRPGVIRIFEGNKVRDRVLVTGGFAEVTPERCTILATESFDFDDKSKEAIDARHEAVRQAHDKALEDGKKAMLRSEMEVMQAIADAFIQEQDQH